MCAALTLFIVDKRKKKMGNRKSKSRKKKKPKMFHVQKATDNVSVKHQINA